MRFLKEPVKIIIIAKTKFIKLKSVKKFFLKISEAGLGFTELSIFFCPFFSRSDTSIKLRPDVNLKFVFFSFKIMFKSPPNHLQFHTILLPLF